MKGISFPKLGIRGTKLQFTHSGMRNGITHSFILLLAQSYSRVSHLHHHFIICISIRGDDFQITMYAQIEGASWT